MSDGSQDEHFSLLPPMTASPYLGQAYCKTSGTNPSPKSVTYTNTLRYYSMTILTVCPGTFVVPSIKSMRIVPTSFCTWRAFCVVA